MNRSTRWLLLFAAAAAACGKKSEPAKPAVDAAPAAVSAPAAEAPAAPSQPKARLINVMPDWVILDSKPVVRIFLHGENLPEQPLVTAESPLITIQKIESNPGQTIVYASFLAGTPPGDYQFQYTAPGQDLIPFKIHYKAPK